MAEIKDFGRKVKKIMKQRGITQSWLAQKIGATEATLSRYVNNSRKPQADIAAEIAEALDVSLDYLTHNTDYQHITQTSCRLWGARGLYK